MKYDNSNRSANAIATFADRFWSKVRKGEDCWWWRGHIQKNGYGLFAVSRSHNRTAHRVAWSLVCGSIPNGLFVLHKCDNRSCVNPKHLFLGTQRDNQIDMSQKGRAAKGERNAMTTLTASEVLSIRTVYAESGLSQQQIAEQFGTSQRTVSRIVRGETWKGIIT